MPSPEPYVFISYSRRDEDSVRKLVDRLAANGIRVWRDVAEISPGQDWRAEIESAVISAIAFIWVSSANSSRSAWMANELQAFAAMRQGMPIIPVLLDDAGEQNLPSILQTRQWVDLRRDFDFGIQKIIQALATALPKHRPPLTTVAPRTKGYVFISYVEEDRNFVTELKE